MSTRLFPPTIAARLALGTACLLTAIGCGGELLRTGRAPVYLVITGITASAGGGDESAFLLSDVRTEGSVVNDNVTITLRVDQKNPTAATSTLNAVTLTRYRVVFRRSDGRNTPGVDVPYGFDGGLSRTIEALGVGSVSFELVRHQAKLEPPLSSMTRLGGQMVITSIAEITLWGRDQNGNELTVTGSIDVHFGDFPDE